MTRPTVAAALTAAALTASALTLGPAAAGLATAHADLPGLPAGSSSQGSSTSAPAAKGSWGHTSSHEQKLTKACRTLGFRYAVTAPTDAWMVEFHLVNPNGHEIASRELASDDAPAQGTAHWRVCRSTTVSGTHTIKMVVTSYTADDTATERAGRPTRFKVVSGR